MRRLEIVVGVVTVTFVLSGCANFRDREWGTCAIAGAVVGGAAGGIVGGTVINNEGDPTDAERGGAIAGGIVGGAALGALLGHVLCDPIRVEEPPKVAQVPPAPEPPDPPDLSGETHFAFDSAQLTPSGEATLDQTVAIMREHPDLRVVCEGYTDSVGTEAYNLGLSERRADSACGYLERQGISSSRLETRGFGESNPIASNDTEEGRAQNRRVEIDRIN